MHRIIDTTNFTQGPVKDSVSLIDHLRAISATVVPTGTVTQPFFSVTGQTIAVNGKPVQVYEYANEDDANADAARISPDGGTMGNTMVDRIALPIFKGRSAHCTVCWFEYILRECLREDAWSSVRWQIRPLSIALVQKAEHCMGTGTQPLCR